MSHIHSPLFINTILFDLDGTLVDSAVETRTVLNEMRCVRGYDLIDDEQFRPLISHGAASLIKSALNPHDDELQSLIDEFRAKYNALITPVSSIYPSVIETLTVLKERGFELGVCTNKPQNLCDNVLRDTGLDSFFSCVVAGGPSVKPKPHHDPILLAISRLGADARTTLLIGDSTTDQRAAQSADIPFIFYASGYNDGVLEDQALASIIQMNELLDLELLASSSYP